MEVNLKCTVSISNRQNINRRQTHKEASMKSMRDIILRETEIKVKTRLKISMKISIKGT
jgi:hypothetical protein